MKPTKLGLIGFILLIVIAASPPTFAQYRDMLGTPFSNPLSASMSTQIWNKINQHSLTGSYGKKSKGRTSVAPAAPTIDYGPVVEDTTQGPPKRVNQAVQFKPTGTRLAMQEMVDSFGGTDPQKKEAKDLLQRIFNKYEADAAARGYPNDLAFALVSYIAFNSYVYSGGSGSPTLPPEQSVALRNNIAEYAAQNGLFNNLTDRNRQQIYEGLIMLGGITYEFYLESKTEKDNEALKKSKSLAADNLKSIGIQL